MATIKNIIFDLGNVLLNLDLGRTASILRAELGEQAFQNAYQQLQQERVFELYETGGMSTAEFVDRLCQMRAPALSENFVMDAWNAILLDLPAHRLEMLLRLRQQYKVFLLSNINELHADWISAYLERAHGVVDFETRYFDAAYYSHLIRLRKPNREIYEYVLADAELVAEETLFFDDLEANVAAARQLGIRGVLHPAGSDAFVFE